MGICIERIDIDIELMLLRRRASKSLSDMVIPCARGAYETIAVKLVRCWIVMLVKVQNSVMKSAFVMSASFRR